MALSVRFKVSDKRADRYGDIVTATGDRIEHDPTAPGRLNLYENGRVKTSFKGEDLRRVEAAEDHGDFGVSL